MDVPDVKFATSEDGIRIAYQVWGEGPTLVNAPALLSHVEVSWENEHYRRCLERLGRHLRVIQFDKRGIGLSDRSTTIRPSISASPISERSWTRRTSSEPTSAAPPRAG